MNINTAVEIVPDTSVIVGYIKESYREEEGHSFSCIETIKERQYHIIRISKAIRKECELHFEKEGRSGYDILKTLLAPLELRHKVKKIVYNQEEIELGVSLPDETDRPVAETAVAVRNKYQRIPVFLVTKNLRHFDPIEWHEGHNISVMSPEGYVADP